MKQVTIKVRVPTDRSFVGELIVNVNGEKTTFPVSSMISPEINGTEPPVGNYTWVKTATVTGDDNINAFGEYVVFFQKESEEIMLAVHGGATDLHGLLLATEGGLRLHDMDLLELCQLIEDSTPTLVIEEYNLSFYRKLTGSKISKNVVRPRYYSVHGSNARTSFTGTSLSDNNYYNDDLSDMLYLLWLLSDNSQSSNQTQDPGIISGEGGDFGGGGVTGSFPETADSGSEITTPTSVEPAHESSLPIISNPFEMDRTEVIAKQSDSDRVSVQDVINTPPENNVENAENVQVTTSSEEVMETNGTAY